MIVIGVVEGILREEEGTSQHRLGGEKDTVEGEEDGVEVSLLLMSHSLVMTS